LRRNCAELRQRRAGADLLEGEDGGLADGRLAVLEQREHERHAPLDGGGRRRAAALLGRERAAEAEERRLARAPVAVLERRPQPIERVRRRHRERRRRDGELRRALAHRRLCVAHPLDERRPQPAEERREILLERVDDSGEGAERALHHL